MGDKIYLDPKIATSESAVHEYAHLWAAALRRGNRAEWANVIELMKGTGVWEEVKRMYPELEGDDAIAEEVLAWYSGRRGAERLRAEREKAVSEAGSVLEKASVISMFERVKRGLERFWRAVSDMFHIRYRSAEEVADRVMYDMLRGFNPNEVRESEEGIDNREKRIENRGGEGNRIDPRTMSDEEKERRGNMLRQARAVEVEKGVITSTRELSARKAAERWWDENVGESVFYDTEAGKVEINRNSIEGSLAHRYGQKKLDAITSLVEGFENAVYLGTLPDFDRQGGVNSHYFAYPIMYDGELNYVFCRAMQDANKNRLYVHEVFVGDKLKKGDTLQTAASQPHGGIALYRDILANVLEGSGGKDSEKVSDVQEGSVKNVGCRVKWQVQN